MHGIVLQHFPNLQEYVKQIPKLGKLVVKTTIPSKRACLPATGTESRLNSFKSVMGPVSLACPYLDEFRWFLDWNLEKGVWAAKVDWRDGEVEGGLKGEWFIQLVGL